MTLPLRPHELPPSGWRPWLLWLWRSTALFPPIGIRHSALPASGMKAAARTLAFANQEEQPFVSQGGSGREGIESKGPGVAVALRRVCCMVLVGSQDHIIARFNEDVTIHGHCRDVLTISPNPQAVLWCKLTTAVLAPPLTALPRVSRRLSSMTQCPQCPQFSVPSNCSVISALSALTQCPDSEECHCAHCIASGWRMTRYRCMCSRVLPGPTIRSAPKSWRTFRCRGMSRWRCAGLAPSPSAPRLCWPLRTASPSPPFTSLTRRRRRRRWWEGAACTAPWGAPGLVARVAHPCRPPAHTSAHTESLVGVKLLVWMGSPVVWSEMRNFKGINGAPGYPQVDTSACLAWMSRHECVVTLAGSHWVLG
ncbi:hypothetical protein HaLaN_06022 [Haematococcus lacustris]|uniref:Uncharacterized protein n=1 Tax=Haematococcus lacustris TaxID=44745 RepID=A0A699YKB0_HAELA|nr:hypothetical protein HaLaN_06022 [Haematococcus lacustris]